MNATQEQLKRLVDKHGAERVLNAIKLLEKKMEISQLLKDFTQKTEVLK
jgi:hypothetical protein